MQSRTPKKHWGESKLEKYAADSKAGMGIPDPSNFGDVTSLQPGSEVPFVVQLHNAKRAGKHYDVRFGPDQMFSWATRKGLPGPGERVSLFQTPLHEGSYAGYEGPLEGYGAGTVRQHEKGSVIVTKATPDQVSFITAHGKYPQRYTLVRNKTNPKTWLAVNTTPASLNSLLAKHIPPSAQVDSLLNVNKEHYRSTPAEDISKLYDPNATFSEKLDGAAALYKLMEDRVEATSYRTSKTGRPILHTERLQLPKGLKIPPHLVGTVLRGEIWGEQQPDSNVKLASIMLGKTAQEAIPPEVLGGILNASLSEALKRQRERRIRLKNALFDIRYYGKKPIDPQFVPYKQRVEMLNEVLKYLPAEQFHLPQMATTPEEQRKLWESIRAGKNPRTHEGVVVWPEKGMPTKVKILPEYKVYISKMFPGEGKYKDTAAGGFEYSLQPGGPSVGRVGTGFSDELRRELWQNQDEYTGRVARIRAQGQFPSGAYRAPALIALHEDYPAVEKAADVQTPLQPHQQRVVDKLQKGNLLVAHGMGSGKTLSSLAAAEAVGEPTTFLTPASLTKNIDKEIAKHTTKGLDVPYSVKSLPTAVIRKEELPAGGLTIIDEAHSLRNPGSQRVHYFKSQRPKMDRLMLLTGTPAYNKASDIAPLINLVKGEHVLPEKPTEFESQYIKKHKVNPGFLSRLFLGLKPGETYELKNAARLRDIMKGSVDVFNEPHDFPSRTDEDIHAEMSNEQQNVYDYLEGKFPAFLKWKIRMGLPPSKAESKALNSFMTGVRQASNSVYPYVAGMDLSAAAEQSPKLRRAAQEIIQRQKDKNFKAFVYTNYMDAGARPLSAYLTKNKIPNAIFHGGLSSRDKYDLVNAYNSGRLPVLIGTSSAAEGIDLKGTKLLQILEPHFNEAKLNQVIARGIRYRSHHHLPEEERKVHVQRFYSTPQQGWLSWLTGKRRGVDEWMHDRAVEKEKVMQQLYDVMKQAT